MNKKTEITNTREIDLSIDLDVDAQTVWAALTEGRRIASWFPLYAEATGGHGSSVTLSWGEGMEWTTRVTEWEPGKHLRWTDPAPDDAPATQVSAIDFHIYDRDGGVTLRLVNSGFGADDKWDEQYEATKAGWAYFLYNLQHYLRFHPQRIREMIWARGKLEGDRDEIWGRILASLDGEVAAGSPVGLELIEGGRCEGLIEILAPTRTMAMRIPELNEALLFIELEPGERDVSCGIWLSTYDLESADSYRTGIDALMEKLATA